MITANDLIKLAQLYDECIECMAEDCCFNHCGTCRYPMVGEKRPMVTAIEGCLCYHCVDQ